LYSWLRRTSQEALTQGYAATLAGRKRFFNVAGLDKSHRAAMERTAKNHPIQGTNADILKRALALLYETLPARASLRHREKLTHLLSSRVNRKCQPWCKLCHEAGGIYPIMLLRLFHRALIIDRLATG
jgi:hypothetical protein